MSWETGCTLGLQPLRFHLDWIPVDVNLTLGGGGGLCQGFLFPTSPSPFFLKSTNERIFQNNGRGIYQKKNKKCYQENE